MKQGTCALVVLLLCIFGQTAQGQTGWRVDTYVGYNANVNNQGNLGQFGWTTGNLGNAWAEGEWVPYCLSLKNVDMTVGAGNFTPIEISYDFSGGNPAARFVDLVRGIQVGIQGSDYFPLGSKNNQNDYGWPSASGMPYPLTTAAELQIAQNNQTQYVWGTLVPWKLLNLPQSQVNVDLTGGLGTVTDAERKFVITYNDLRNAGGTPGQGVPATYTGDLQIYFNLHLSQTFIWSLSLQSQLAGPPTDDWGGYVYGLTPFDIDQRNGSGYVPGASGHTVVLGAGSRSVPIPIPPPPNGEISGLKFFDINGNHAQDIGEPVLQDWDIYITTSVGGTPVSYMRTTDASGIYSLTGLPGSVYIVSEEYQGLKPLSSPPPNYPYVAFNQTPPSTWDETYPELTTSINGGLAIGTATSAAGLALGYGPESWAVDLITTPVHSGINFGNYIPPPQCRVLPLSTTVCQGTPVTFTVERIADGTPPYSVAWSGPPGWTPPSAPQPWSINLTAGTDPAGTYTAILTDANGFTSQGCTGTLALYPQPVCSISPSPQTPPVVDFCEGSQIVFTGPDANATTHVAGWSWSVTGNATISGSATGQTVTVNVGLAANGTSFAVLLTTSTSPAEGSCTESCTYNYTIAPLITCPPPVTVTCAADIPAHDFAFGTTNCPNVIVTWVSDVESNYSGPNCKTITRTYSGSITGLTVTCQQIITVADNIAPVVTVPATSLTMQCFSASAVAAWAAGASALDNCDGSVAVTPSYTAPADNCNHTVTVTFTATDGCGNTGTATKDFLVNDTTPPVITVPPASLSMQCYNPSAVAAWVATASADDNCDGSVTVTPTWTPPVDNCNRTVTVTFTAVDHCLNQSTATKTFLVNDVTPPVITVPPANLSMQCYDASTVAAWAATASALDNCDGTVTVTPSWTAPLDNCNRTVTVTFAAQDNCGNQSSATKTFLVNDVTPPVITLPPANLTMQCYDAGIVATWAATASALDNCDGTVTVTPSWTAPPDNCNRTVTVTFATQDNCGNQSSATKTFLVNDVTPPVITVPPANLTMQCYDAGVVAAWAATATAVDNCDGPVAVTPSWTAPPDNCNRTVTVTFTSQDNCGNQSTETKTFLVNDVTPPVITVPPANLTMQCYDAGIVATWAATASAIDNCDGNVAVTPSWTAPVDNCNRTVTVTFTSQDNCGNQSTATKTFLVNDVTPPVITVPPATLTMQCYDAGIVATWAATASALDNCDGPVAVTPSWTAPPDNCNRTVIVTFTSQDNCGNQSTATKTFLVNDVTPPVITVPPASLTMQCYDAGTVAAWAATATALDNCDGSVAVTPSWTAPPDNCNRTVVVTFSSQDNCGNQSSATKTFLVNDVTPPVITVPPASLTMQCYDAGAVATWAATASAFDNCDGTVTVTPTWNAPPDNCNRTVTVTFTSQDNCGNQSTETKTFLVNDNTPPVITVPPATLTMQCYNPASAAAWAATASASDNCDGNVTVTPTWSAPIDNCNRTVTVTFSAQDNCGNQSSATKTFLVNDNTPPVITVPPAPLTMACFDAGAVDTWAGTASAVDNCDGTVTVTPTYTPPIDNCDRTVTVTFSAQDNCGNQSTATRTFYVNDDVNPTISGYPDFTVNCGQPIIFNDPDIDDNCSPAPTLVVVLSTITYNGGLINHIKSWKAVDACGNESATVTQVITELCNQFGSLTQGYYGNPGGSFCGTGQGTATLIDSLIQLNGGTITVGVPLAYPSGGSLTIHSADASCIIQYLPGGGTPTVLTADYGFLNGCIINPSGMPLNSYGRFDNILLSQTITLTLNLLLDPTLGTSFYLPPPTTPWMRTQGSDYVNGICLDGNDIPDNTFLNFYFPPSVLSGLNSNGTNKTPQDLLTMANNALAGLAPVGVTLSDIVAALDAINKGFDNARFFSGYYVTPPPKAASGESVPSGFALHPNHPNPFNPSTTISFTLPVECNVRLAVYNALGNEVAVLVNHMVPAGTHSVVWNAQATGSELPSGVYTYRILAIGGDNQEFHDVRKMMLVK